MNHQIYSLGYIYMNTGLENLGPEAMPKVAGGFFQLWNERFRGSASVELLISKRRSASPPGATTVEADYLEADLNGHAVEYFSDRLSTADHFFIQMFHSR
ncbi:predicted protein [Botrytis cinerea T4]|uniref:Uncharacterized protein n=1 Tax=Botryotinia fuckeliana (strain T4) TaxID=999810 RepID=G2XXC0_BOTF4|nr:predicted protein [Botrytis cinerea T4]